MIRPLVAQTFEISSIGDERRERAGGGAAVLLGEHQAEEAVLAEELDHVPRELGAVVDLGRARRDALARERPDEVADLALCSTVSTSRSLDPASRYSRSMILENGLIRTLDPQIPTQRALAIAGEWIAGGVGVHETALASPDVVDLGGRVVAAGASTTRTSTSRRWALAQPQVRLDGCASLDEALARIRGAERDPRSRGCAGAAGAAATGAAPSRRRSCSTR